MIDKIPSNTLKKLLIDLTDTMREVNLVGIAAPQVGVSSRVFLTEVRKTILRKDISNFDALRVFINPKITQKSKKLLADYEGCGSVASGGLFGTVKRPTAVVVEAWNENGEKFTLKASGLLGRIIQHEIDHLNGTLFVDQSHPKTFLSLNEYLKMREKSK